MSPEDTEVRRWLVSRAFQFEKVHDLGRLLDHCASVDGDFETLRDEVEPLTLYAVALGYPGPAEPTHAEVQSALTVVEHAWSFVTDRLDSRMMP